MRFSKPRAARLRVRSWDPDEAPIEVSGEIHLDKKMHEFPERIEVLGTESESIQLMGFVGSLVEIEEISTFDDRTQTFVGRVNSVGGFASSSTEHVKKIAEITVQKAVDEFPSGRGRKRYCSYIYSTDVGGWPMSGMFQLSYKGSIELREFPDGLHSLLNRDGIKLTASPNFYFHDEGRKLIRQKLASIQMEWKAKTLDYKRLMDCARIVMSFTHTVKLRPLSKSYSDGKKYRRVSWNPTNLETVDRDTYSGPISISDQQVFHTQAIDTLFTGDYSIDALDGVIDRYVEARTDVAIERSFAHGCEAIEALYSLMKKSLPAGSTETYPKLRKELKRVIAESIDNDDDRATASSKIDQLFNRPTWQRVKDLILSLRKESDDLILRVVERANFFRYRNIASHGQVVRLDNEVVCRPI